MTVQHSTAGIVTGAEPYSGALSVEAEIFARDVRRISRETLERLGAGSGTVFFPRLERRSATIVWPYRRGGEVINWKAAAFPEKAFTSKKGGELAFFNLDVVLAGSAQAVFITEGEWDAAALVEAGIPADAVLSVPNGAREKAVDKQGDDKPGSYAFVEDALRAGLSRIRRFVWCGDADGPGLSLRHDMARILGAARFYYVDWPEGAKDANDFLRTDGCEALRDLVTDGAQPWPVDGLYRLSEIPEPPRSHCGTQGFSNGARRSALLRGRSA